MIKVIMIALVMSFPLNAVNTKVNIITLSKSKLIEKLVDLDNSFTEKNLKSKTKNYILNKIELINKKADNTVKIVEIDQKEEKTKPVLKPRSSNKLRNIIISLSTVLVSASSIAAYFYFNKDNLVEIVEENLADKMIESFIFFR